MRQSTYSKLHSMLLALGAFAADTLTGTPAQILDRLGRFAELGVEEVIVAPAPIPFAIPDSSIPEILAAEVLPAARSL